MQTKEFFSEGETVCVLTSQPIDRLLDYRAPAGGCRLRAFVEVPGYTKRQWRWVFSKQPIQPLNNCFEDEKDG